MNMFNKFSWEEEEIPVNLHIRNEYEIDPKVRKKQMDLASALLEHLLNSKISVKQELGSIDIEYYMIKDCIENTVSRKCPFQYALNRCGLFWEIRHKKLFIPCSSIYLAKIFKGTSGAGDWVTILRKLPDEILLTKKSVVFSFRGSSFKGIWVHLPELGNCVITEEDYGRTGQDID